jgi:hypothetical protein
MKKKRMNKDSIEFNQQLAIDVLVNNLTEITREYVNRLKRPDLTDVIIPEGVTTIGEDAFRDCSNLKNVTVPESVTSIGDNAFGARTKHMYVLFTDRSLDSIPGMRNYPWYLGYGELAATKF